MHRSAAEPGRRSGWLTSWSPPPVTASALLGRHLARWDEVGYRVELAHTTPVEQPGDVDRVLGGVHHDLGVLVGDDRNRTETVAARRSQRALVRPPRTLHRVQVHPAQPGALGELV